jgi:hypothetical protein
LGAKDALLAVANEDYRHEVLLFYDWALTADA